MKEPTRATYSALAPFSVRDWEWDRGGRNRRGTMGNVQVQSTDERDSHFDGIYIDVVGRKEKETEMETEWWKWTVSHVKTGDK